MKPFKITLHNNIHYAQAWGCWLYVQVGEYAVKAGRRMPFGLRVVWKRLLPWVSVRRFPPSTME